MNKIKIVSTSELLKVIDVPRSNRGLYVVGI